MADEKKEWRVRCPKCGRSKSLREIGGVRVGSSSGKRVLGWCRGCRWFRWAIMEYVAVQEEKKEN
jgi:hypothetical protein